MTGIDPIRLINSGSDAILDILALCIVAAVRSKTIVGVVTTPMCYNWQAEDK